MRIFLMAVFLMAAQFVYGSTVDTGEIFFNNHIRYYRIFVPSAHKKGGRLPVVIILHRDGGNALWTEKYTGFSKLAEREGFIAVYPEGFGASWNDGRKVPRSAAHRMKINDIGFISAVLETVKEKYSVDEDKIYAAGMSGGGMMAFRLACALPGVFNAVAGVSANIPVDIYDRCKPEKGIRAVVINGTGDPIMPYNGGYVTKGEGTRLVMGKVVSTENTAGLWVNANALSIRPFKTERINNDRKDSTSVEKIVFGEDAKVVVYKVIGGGHTWPGAARYKSRDIVGRTSREINATEEIWEFFKGEREKSD
ncbi:MAG: alpha/beta hydrolase family esterase [Candidatus Goldiibacteriota bacterium]